MGAKSKNGREGKRGEGGGSKGEKNAGNWLISF